MVKREVKKMIEKVLIEQNFPLLIKVLKVYVGMVDVMMRNVHFIKIKNVYFLFIRLSGDKNE